MSSAPSSSSSEGWGSYLWNSLPKRAAQSGISSGILAAGETLLLCSLTPEPVVTAVQYVATGVLVSGALIFCHSLGDKEMSYSEALSQPVIQGRRICLMAQAFFNSSQTTQESSAASSSSGPSSPLPPFPSDSLEESFSSPPSHSSPLALPMDLPASELLSLPAASSSSSSSSFPASGPSSPPPSLSPSGPPASPLPARANPSLASIPKKVGAAALQTLKGTTRILEFCGAEQDAVAVGIALGGTTFVISEDEEASAIVAGTSAAIVGIALTVQASSRPAVVIKKQE